MIRAYTILLTTFVLFAACKSNKAQTANSDTSDEKLVLLLSDNYGGPAEEDLMVCRSAGELNKFFMGVNKTRKPGLTPPKVDFDKYMVIVYCAGQSNPGELNLKVKNEDSDHIDLMVERPKTDNSVGVTALVEPFYIYAIPNTEKKVRLASQ